MTWVAWERWVREAARESERVGERPKYKGNQGRASLAVLRWQKRTSDSHTCRDGHFWYRCWRRDTFDYYAIIPPPGKNPSLATAGKGWTFCSGDDHARVGTQIFSTYVRVRVRRTCVALVHCSARWYLPQVIGQQRSDQMMLRPQPAEYPSATGHTHACQSQKVFSGYKSQKCRWLAEVRAARKFAQNDWEVLDRADHVTHSSYLPARPEPLQNGLHAQPHFSAGGRRADQLGRLGIIRSKAE